MATSNTHQTPSDFEEYIRDLLECPVCMETIKSVPVYQCANGHVICKICIEKLNNCPICRNDSAPARSLQLEKIVVDPSFSGWTPSSLWTCWFFQICKNCDQENIIVHKLNLLYQISLSQDFKNVFILIRMSLNHDKLLVWNVSNRVRWPCKQ